MKTTHEGAPDTNNEDTLVHRFHRAMWGVDSLSDIQPTVVGRIGSGYDEQPGSSQSYRSAIRRLGQGEALAADAFPAHGLPTRQLNEKERAESDGYIAELRDQIAVSGRSDPTTFPEFSQQEFANPDAKRFAEMHTLQQTVDELAGLVDERY